jgi:predicted nucleic acid-binding protein
LRYLVDTDWIIDHFNGRKDVTERLKEYAKEGLATSIITVAELYEGVFGSKDFKKALKGLETFLNGITIVNIDTETCKIFGEKRHRLRKTGNMIGDFDLLIASICLRHNLTLLTNNRRHYERIDNLQIISI